MNKLEIKPSGLTLSPEQKEAKKDQERRELAFSSISQRYAFLRQAMELGLPDLNELAKDAKRAVDQHPEGGLMLYDAANHHMHKKTIFDSMKNSYRSRYEILGPNEAIWLRNKSISLVEGQESRITAPK